MLTEFCNFQAPDCIYGNSPADGLEISGVTSTILNPADPWQYHAIDCNPRITDEVNITRVISVISQNDEPFFNQGLIQGLKYKGLVPHHIALGDFSDLEGDVIIILDLESRFFEDISEKKLKLFQELYHAVDGKNIVQLMPPMNVNYINP